MVRFAEKGVTVESVVHLVVGRGGQGVDCRGEGPMCGLGVDREAGQGSLGAEEVLGQGGMKEAGVLVGRAGIAARDQAAEGGEDLKHPRVIRRSLQRRAGAHEQRQRQDRPGPGDGQRPEHWAEPCPPVVRGARLVQRNA